MASIVRAVSLKGGRTRLFLRVEELMKFQTKIEIASFASPSPKEVITVLPPYLVPLSAFGNLSPLSDNSKNNYDLFTT